MRKQDAGNGRYESVMADERAKRAKAEIKAGSALPRIPPPPPQQRRSRKNRGT